MDDVGRDGPDLHEAVVLDEDRVARQVPVHDRRLRPLNLRVQLVMLLGNITNMSSTSARIKQTIKHPMNKPTINRTAVYPIKVSYYYSY